MSSYFVPPCSPGPHLVNRVRHCVRARSLTSCQLTPHHVVSADREAVKAQPPWNKHLCQTRAFLTHQRSNTNFKQPLAVRSNLFSTLCKHCQYCKRCTNCKSRTDAVVSPAGVSARVPGPPDPCVRPAGGQDTQLCTGATARHGTNKELNN